MRPSATWLVTLAFFVGSCTHDLDEIPRRDGGTERDAGDVDGGMTDGSRVDGGLVDATIAGCTPGAEESCGSCGNGIRVCSNAGTWCNCQRSNCASACPADFGGWMDACGGNGCAVCSEVASAYPCYFANHPSCVRNEACGGGSYVDCSSACPPPTTEDTCACDGSAGGLPAACQGSGCRVCVDRVRDYPCYFINHPACAPNAGCSGEYYQCNALCPPPTASDMGTAT